MNRELMESRLAVLVLRDTNRARDAISQQNDALANQCVQAALNASKRINQMNASQNSQQANLVPIYAEFSQLTVWGPISRQQQRHSQMAFNRNNGINAESESEASNTGEASREAPAKSQQSGQEGEYGQHPAIQAVTQNLTGVFLDVNMAEKHLEAANTALQDHNTVAADDALAAVQDGVALVSVEADRPLVQARENLALARDLAQQGRYQEMAAPLRAAADALVAYHSEGTAHAGDAANLARQIRSYAASLNSSANQNSSSTVQQIDNWWQMSRSWSPSSPSQ